MTTLVLGAGVIGTTTAHYLAAAGEAVTVIDRQAEAGVETSFANGGLVTPSMSDPWGAPGLPLKLVKWMGSEDAPFLLRARAIPGLTKWGLRFLANCRDSRWRENAETVYRVAEYSAQQLDELTKNTGISYDRRTEGNLRVFRDEPSMHSAMKATELVAQFGVNFQALDRHECTALEPALSRVADQLVGGVAFPDDDSGDAFKFTQALAHRCEQLGVRFRYNETISHLDFDSDRTGDHISGVVLQDGSCLKADHYVLALGSYSPLLAKPLGIRLPVYPVKGYSLTIPNEGMDKSPQIPVVDDGRKLGVTPLGDRLRAAGTAEFNGYDTSPNPERSALLVAALRGLYPQVNIPDDCKPWCGLRPVTPDGSPILGATKYNNLYLNCGQGHLGWTMSCGSAKIISDLVTGQRPDIDMRGLTLDRF